MSRRYADLDDLIHDLDAQESLSDDPFGAPFDDEDFAILGSVSPDTPRASRAAVKKAPAKRGRPKQKKS
jgi:hypothetical protein